MSDQEKTIEENEQQETTEEAPASRFPEMDELQSDIARRIRDNQKFLDRFMDDDFVEENDEEDDEDDEIFEEL
ncbi:MAG: hypothetical protein C0615_05820 [Desulfuromonas sp.]|nr:MAG: hypothetical protein C0615_05820 [Desulfuromonas sp.]